MLARGANSCSCQLRLFSVYSASSRAHTPLSACFFPFSRAAQALTSYMFFGRDHRDAVSAELGTTDPKVVSKALGEKWAAQADKAPWERLAEQDKARFDRENNIYLASLQSEADEEQASKDAAAAGPSEREAERAEKRARMEEEAAIRAAKPKAPRKEKVLSAEAQALQQQNKDIMGDMDKSAKQRLAFLLGQSDLFKHFVKDEDLEKIGKGKGKAGGGKKRKSEKEEDDEMMASADAEASGHGGTSQSPPQHGRSTAAARQQAQQRAAASPHTHTPFPCSCTRIQQAPASRRRSA